MADSCTFHLRVLLALYYHPPDGDATERTLCCYGERCSCLVTNCDRCIVYRYCCNKESWHVGKVDFETVRFTNDI